MPIYKQKILEVHEQLSIFPRVIKYEGMIIVGVYIYNNRKRLIQLGRYNRKHININIQDLINMGVSDAQNYIRRKNKQYEKLRKFIVGKKKMVKDVTWKNIDDYKIDDFN